MKLIFASLVLLALIVWVGVVVKSAAGARRRTSDTAASARETKGDEPATTVVRHVISFERTPPPRGDVASTSAAAQERPAGSAERREIAPAELIGRLEAAFQQDDLPNSQSTQMTAAIRSAFESAPAKGASIKSIECRASRCRMQISFEDRAADRRIMKDFFTLLSSKGIDIHGLRFIAPSRETTSDGRTLATIHVYRGDAPLL